MRREAGPPARRLWRLVEPYHALTYFAPEARDAFEAAGLRGFWRGYFAGRAAPLGEVGPGIVTACFYGFHPDFVGRALPSIWTMADPPTALDARLTGVDAALRRVLGESVGDQGLAEAATIVRGAVEGCPVAGRPLFAANAELGWPQEPHLALWHAATLLREHRGDGHVVALVHAGLDPCEAHVSKTASDGIPHETLQPYRGWSEEDWAAAADRLRTRGWLDGDGHLTPEGRAGRRQVEDETDRLASAPVEHMEDADLDRLFRLLEPVARELLEADAIPYPNAVGVPPPELPGG